MVGIVQTFNEIWEPVFTQKARYKFLFGGRARGGSHTATDYFLHKQTQPDYFRGYFMREIFGDVRNSLWQDYKDRIGDNESLNEADFALNESALTSIYFPTGNAIISKGFKKSSGKQTAKLKSIAGATHVCVEELEEVDEMDFDQMDSSLRTTKGEIEIVGIFNPPHKNHWLIRRFYNLIPAEDVYGPEFQGFYIAVPKQLENFLSIHATYLDNLDNVNATTRNIFERYRETNFEYYATMIKGLVSEGAKGVIYKNWKPCTVSEFEALPYESFYGLDFGFSNDPAACVKVKAHNDNLWFHEMFYKRGLTNAGIVTEFEINGIPKDAEIYADSAEPKSIEEIRQRGYNIIPSVKGADSIRAGIKFILSKDVRYTETSTNLIFERDNYTYALDANKEPTDRPIDKYNHLKDAERYAVYTKFAAPSSDLVMLDASGNLVKV
jgi:phage terminase large subunit